MAYFLWFFLFLFFNITKLQIIFKNFKLDKTFKNANNKKIWPDDGSGL